MGKFFVSLFRFAKAGRTGGTEPQGGAECGCSINKVQMLGLEEMQHKVQSFLSFAAELLQNVL